MTTYLRALGAALAVGFVFAGLFAVWREHSQPLQGIAAIERMDSMESGGLPVFEAKDLEGRPFRLADFKDQIVIVNFWATWCGPCVEEIPSLLSLVEAMGGKVKLVAVSGDDSRDDVVTFLKAFPKMNNPNVTILLDLDRSVSKLYGVDRFPESFIGGKNLRLAKKIVGSIPWFTEDSKGYMADLYGKE